MPFCVSLFNLSSAHSSSKLEKIAASRPMAFFLPFANVSTSLGTHSRARQMLSKLVLQIKKLSLRHLAYSLPPRKALHHIAFVFYRHNYHRCHKPLNYQLCPLKVVTQSHS